jgi:hypothetical protein
VKWRSVRDSIPAADWPMWVVTEQEPESPAVGWWDGSDWWIFIDGHGAELHPETVTHWIPMVSPCPPEGK